MDGKVSLCYILYNSFHQCPPNFHDKKLHLQSVSLVRLECGLTYSFLKLLLQTSHSLFKGSLRSGKVKHELRVTNSNPRVTNSNTRVTSSNTRVTSSNPRLTSSNSQVTSSNPRVQIHELED